MSPDLFCPKITIVDCGASRTALGVFRRSAGRLRLETSAVERFPSANVGEDLWLQHTAAALGALRARAAPAGRVVLVLPPHLTLAKHIRTPRVSATKRDRIVRFEVAQAMPCDLAEVVWGTTIATETATGTGWLLAAGKRRVLEGLGAVAKQAGFAPAVMLPAALTTLVAGRLALSGAGSSALILNLGARSTVMVQLAAERFGVRTLSLGGNGAPGPALDATGAFVTRVAQEVTRTMLHFNRQGGLGPPAVILLTGGAARMAGLSGALAAQLNLPVKHPAWRDQIETTGKGDPALATDDFEPVDLIGAAAIGLLPLQPCLNLRPRRGSGGWRRWSGLVAVAGLTAALGLLSIGHNRLEPARTAADWPEQMPVPPAQAPVARDPAAPAERPEPSFGLELLAIRSVPYRLQLIGYAGKAGRHVVALAATTTGRTLFAREGQSIEDLAVTLKGFLVHQVALAVDFPRPVFGLIAQAVVRDERTGQEVLLDNRTPATVPLAVVRSTGDNPQVIEMHEGETCTSQGVTYRIERIGVEPSEVAVACIRSGSGEVEKGILRLAQPQPEQGATPKSRLAPVASGATQAGPGIETR